VPAHTAASVCQFLIQNNVRTLLSSLCSPELYAPDYFLLPTLKMKLKGLHFVDVVEILEAITDELKMVQEEEFLAAFQKQYDLKKPWLYASGAYFG